MQGRNYYRGHNYQNQNPEGNNRGGYRGQGRQFIHGFRSRGSLHRARHSIGNNW